MARTRTWKENLTALIYQGKIREALGLANEATHSKGTRDEVAELLCQVGAKLSAEKDKHEEALLVFGAAVHLAETEATRERALMNCSVAHSILGVTSGKEGRYEDSERHLKEALKLCPHLSIAHSKYGSLLSLQGRYDEAETHFKEAIRLGSDTNTHINYAQLLARLGRMEEAAQQYEEAQNSDPTNPLCHALYGAALMGCSQFHEAELQIKKALTLDPNLIAANFYYGKLLTKLKRFSQAKGYFKRTLELTPDFADAAVGYDYAVLMELSTDPRKRITSEWLDARRRYFEHERQRDLKDFELQQKHREEWKILYDRFECLRCGRCCVETKWAASIDQRLVWEDVERWRKEGRDDILKYVFVFEGLGGDIFDKEAFESFSKCPFLKKEGKRYCCSIHETKPKICQLAPFYFNNQGICENCGASLKEGDIYCERCGLFLKVSPGAYGCPGMKKTLKSLGLLRKICRPTLDFFELRLRRGNNIKCD